jgi:ankyrin repeat protein
MTVLELAEHHEQTEIVSWLRPIIEAPSRPCNEMVLCFQTLIHTLTPTRLYSRGDLQNTKQVESPLISACAVGDVDAVHWLLANCGAEINEKMTVGVMGLPTVPRSVAQAFWPADRRIDTRQDTGKTPFLVAVEKRHFDLVEFLASKGANVHTKSLVSQLLQLSKLEFVFS